MAVNGGELDLHRLELRYAATRVADPGAARQLTASLERCGQLVPCVAVPDPGGSDRLVLIDGYRRIARVCGVRAALAVAAAGLALRVNLPRWRLARGARGVRAEPPRPVARWNPRG